MLDMKKPYHLFILLGFTSMVSQILLMRELVVVFYGNELTLGIILGGWLFWAGLGSLLAGILLPRLPVFSRVAVVMLLQATLAFMPGVTLLGARALPSLLLRNTAGEIVGYVPIFISSFLLLAPVCLLLGFLFTLFCHRWSGQRAASSISAVYFFEGLGAAAGGMLFAFVLVRFFEPIESVLVLLVLNLAAAVPLLAANRRSIPAAAGGALILLAAAGASLAGLADKLNAQSLRWLWRELNVVESRTSIYGNVTYVEDEEQKSLYENGLLLFSYPDRFSAEESVHFALLEHPNPKRVLLIGGGAGGGLTEVLRHPVERVDYLELDPLIIEIARNHFPPEVKNVLDDPRVEVHNTDGRLFLKQTSQAYDIILLNLPDPYTAQLNRFYTREFFQICKNKLASGGVFSFRISSAENYISPELQDFLGCIHGTLNDIFPHIKVVPGEADIFLASMSSGMLTLDPAVLIDRLAERNIQNDLLFVREYYLPFRLSPERLQTLATALSVDVARRNTDLAPVCYYYDAVLWSKQFKDFSSRALASFARIPFYLPLAAIGILFAAGAIIQSVFPKQWGHTSILVAVGATGFAEITVEVVTLLAFQALHGYVYHKIAVIVTCFMAGLALGAAVTGRVADSQRPRKRLFLLVQAMVCLYPLLLLGALVLMTGEEFSVSMWSFPVSAGAAFPVMAFTAGLVGGLQFPLANALWLSEKPGAARAAGYTYGVDLFGSCLGAFLTTAFLIPIFGIPFACVFAGVMNLGSLALLALSFVPLRAGDR
jgi:spermidine synthase